MSNSTISELRRIWWKDIDPTQGEILDSLMKMVDQELLEFGVSPEGEMLFWPTDLGCEVLGMEPAAA